MSDQRTVSHWELHIDIPYYVQKIHPLYDTFFESRTCSSAWHVDGRELDPWVQQHSFVEIGHEVISMAILSLPLIQVGQSSGIGERIGT